jgi:hypothetical protein
LIHLVAIGLVLGMASMSLAAPEAIDITAARRRAAELLQEGKRTEARPILEQIVAIDPTDHVSWYNLACVRLSDGERDDAEDALRSAIGVGFVDFDQMLRDPDLAALRNSDTVRVVVNGWKRVLDIRGDTDLKAARESLGANYIHIRDDELRINILSSFNEAATAAAHEEIRKAARFVNDELFDTSAPADRPFPWTLVILPTKEHFRVFIPFEGVGGIYDHDQRRLISRDLGPSLRHEFVHVLHHRRMMREGQRHAFWIQEGIASLVERLEEQPDGTLTTAPNWRINIARRLAEPRRLTPWERFFTLDSTTFVTVRPLAMYSQAYAAALWLHDTGELRAWMAAYERGFDEEPTGLEAFENVSGDDAASLQRAWRDWLVKREFVAEQFEDGVPSLGVDLVESDQEGPRVAGVFAGRSAGADSLRVRDVVLAIDGSPVRTVAEAIQMLEGRAEGAKVEVDIRRGRLERTIPVTVVAFDERASRGMADRLR